MTARRFRDPLVATCTAALCLTAADLTFTLQRGSALDVAYAALCLALTGLAYLAAGLGVAALGWGAGATLVAGAFAEGAAGPGLGMGVCLGLGACLAWLGHARWGRPVEGVAGAVGLGLVAGLAYAVVVILWRRVGASHRFFGDPVLSQAVTGGLLLFVLLASTATYHGVRQRLTFGRWLPPAWTLWAALGVGLFAIMPASFGDERWPPATGTTGTAAEPSTARPDIFVLVLDTVRADHLGAYGYDRPTTPELDAWMGRHGRAAVFPLAFSASPWTVPSHASLFSGLPAASHGIHRGNAGGAFYYGRLPPRPVAEAVAEAGYRTALIYANIYLGRIGDGMRGFDATYMPPYLRALSASGEALRTRLLPDVFRDGLVTYPRAARINDGILRVVDAAGPAPVFVIANYMEAHVPLVPLPKDRAMFRDLPRRPGDARADHVLAYEADYDAEIRGLDRELVALLDQLEDRGRLANSWVFITSDHGESIGDHGFDTGHGQSVYNEEVRIPLIVLPPEGTQLVPCDTAVGLEDITATVSAIAGVAPVGVGHDLRQGPPPAARFASLYEVGVPEQPIARATVKDKTKLIARGEARELYDLESDPRELRDLSRGSPELVTALEQLEPGAIAQEVAPAAAAPADVAPTAEEAAALRALGYTE